MHTINLLHIFFESFDTDLTLNLALRKMRHMKIKVYLIYVLCLLLFSGCGHLKPQPEAYGKDNLLHRIQQGFAFPDLQSKHVQHYEKWNSEHPDYLDRMFARSTNYMYYIVEEVERRGLPMELALLPAVESAFKANAISRSKAAGLWQFIPATGRLYGLEQNWWYDGRRNVIDSTNAALDYLELLYKQFDNDWFLALAAYNGGSGNLSKAIRKNEKANKPTDYVNLSLRSETRRYVPKLIALKNIINTPEQFNVKRPYILNQPYFTTLPLPSGQINLSELSKKADINLEKLNQLNPDFLRWTTAPSRSNELLVPIKDVTRVKVALANLKLEKPIEYKRYKVQKGDTLSSIALRFSMSVRTIKKLNKLSNSFIKIGQNLLIPIPAYKQLAKDTPIKSTWKTKKRVHYVKQGDTLWSIANQYKISVKQLTTWNNISQNTALMLNQELLISIN